MMVAVVFSLLVAMTMMIVEGQDISITHDYHQYHLLRQTDNVSTLNTNESNHLQHQLGQQRRQQQEQTQQKQQEQPSSTLGSHVNHNDNIVDRRTLRIVEEIEPSAIELISKNPEDNTITVRLRQVLFGSVDKCGEDASIPEDVAMTMFAIYNNAEQSGEPYCGFYYQTDACFTDDIIVACDSITKDATVELLIRDTYHLDRLEDRTVNPQVTHFNGGTCVGPIGTVGNAVSTKILFNCQEDPVIEPPPINEENRDGPCDTDFNCPLDQFCSIVFSLEGTGSFCRNYAIEGEDCGGNAAPGTEGRCAPRGSFGDETFLGTTCTNTQQCLDGFDFPGTCQAILGTCNKHEDCNTTEAFCSLSSGYCFAKRTSGECCTSPDNGVHECADGLSCTLLFDGPFGSAYTCQ